MLNPSQIQKLERQKLDLQAQDQQVEKGEEKKSKWDSPQQRANFNKNMRQKLKQGLNNLSDLVLLLESLPPTVLENAKLDEDLPGVIKFVEAFLEKADPLPVAEHESGELRTFRNYLSCMENHPNIDDWASFNYLKIINNKRYLMMSINTTAVPIERCHCDILKNHIERLQKYTDPGIFVVMDKNHEKRLLSFNDRAEDVKNRSSFIGQCESNSQILHGKVPTTQLCKPRALLGGKLYDIPMAEENAAAPSTE